jgi:hypothetical protein
MKGSAALKMLAEVDDISSSSPCKEAGMPQAL